MSIAYRRHCGVFLRSVLLFSVLLLVLLPSETIGSGAVDYVPPAALSDAQAEAILENAPVACRLLDGLTLLPGEVLSFWDAAGPFDAAHGYVYGWGILAGKVVPAPAGGVCVTSTALYRAALEAGLEVLERHSHNVPLAWAQGDDAAVSFRVLPDGKLARGWDLRLRNDLGFPVEVRARREGRRVEVELRRLEVLERLFFGGS